MLLNQNTFARHLSPLELLFAGSTCSSTQFYTVKVQFQVLNQASIVGPINLENKAKVTSPQELLTLPLRFGMKSSKSLQSQKYFLPGHLQGILTYTL